MFAFGWIDGLELLLFAAGIYAILRSLTGTRGLGILKGGVGFVVGLYLLLRVLEKQLDITLARFNFVVDNLATTALLAFVVIFQPEVRRGLTRLGERPFSWLAGRGASRSVSPVVEAAGRMSRKRIGSLVFIERSVGVGAIVESGVPLSAEVSAQLLESIFFPNSPLHDGAVIVRGPRIVAASCLLPLSDSPELGRDVGTRHRAAVGVTEETDGISVIVSEQTGRISLAFRGKLRPMRDIRELEHTLSRILEGTAGDFDAVERPPSASFGTDSRVGTKTAFLKLDERATDDGSGKTVQVKAPVSAADTQRVPPPAKGGA